MMDTMVATDLLAQVRSLASLVHDYRDDGERERRLPQPVLAAARRAGLLRLLLPQALGGDQVDLIQALAVAEELSRRDGGIGWNLTFAILSPLFGDYLPARAARAIFAGNEAVVAGSFAPHGRATRVAGGYRLSGRWGFVSGCQHADWIIGNGLLVEGDRPILGPDGAPAPQLFVFPAAAVEIVDTWRTTGMRGTGSHDVIVTDVFVPENHSFPFAAFFSGPTLRPDQGYPRPFMEIAPLFLAAVGLGVARAALETFTALAAAKTPLGMTTPLAQQSTVHERVGRAEATLRAARSYLFETARAVATASAATPPLVLPVRLAAAHAAQSANEVVGVLYQLGGGSAIYETSRLERCFRDSNTLTHHILLAPGGYVAAGEWLLNRACGD